MPSFALPISLKEALSDLADSLPGKELVRAAESLAAASRAGVPPRFDEEAVRIAHAVTRVPAMFSAVSLVLDEFPGKPESVLDLGSGPGAVAWACANRWGSDVSITMVEPLGAWADMASRLGTPHKVWIEADLRRLTPPEPHDLAIAAFSFQELTEKEQARLLEEAWFVARRALLIVESGSLRSFERIRQMRNWLIERGAHIQAPCPHDDACPVPAGDKCHFAVRVERSKAHRLARGGGPGFEDESFSYVLAMKEPATAAAARIVRPPSIRPHMIDVSLCRPEGLARIRVTKKDKDHWKAARKAEWGRRWPA